MRQGCYTVDLLILVWSMDLNVKLLLNREYACISSNLNIKIDIIKLDTLPIAARRSFFFITFSSLLNGFLNPSSAASNSLSLLCAARRSSKLKKNKIEELKVKYCSKLLT